MKNEMGKQENLSSGTARWVQVAAELLMKKVPTGFRLGLIINKQKQWSSYPFPDIHFLGIIPRMWGRGFSLGNDHFLGKTLVSLLSPQESCKFLAWFGCFAWICLVSLGSWSWWAENLGLTFKELWQVLDFHGMLDFYFHFVILKACWSMSHVHVHVFFHVVMPCMRSCVFMSNHAHDMFMFHVLMCSCHGPCVCRLPCPDLFPQFLGSWMGLPRGSSLGPLSPGAHARQLRQMGFVNCTVQEL